MTPSMTECGSCSKIRRSLQVPGSLSSPLHRTYLGLADCLGTNDHFIPVENPAPPRPRSPEFLTSLMMASGSIAKRLLDGLVAVKFEVAIDISRTHAKAPGDDLYLVGMGDQVSHFN